MSIEKSIYHICISLWLIGLDLSHMCDNCNYFQRHKTGIEGWKPRKLKQPKCEKHWYIFNGTTKHTPYRLIEMKRIAIKILSLYNYNSHNADVA